MKKSLSLLALIAVLCLAPLATAETPPSAPVAASPEPAACATPDLLTFDLDAVLTGMALTPAQTEAPQAIRLSCSGDLCGCYTPTCTEECGPPPNPCHSACRKAQKDCAIACCAG
ncbi:MAG: hypothetical protein SF066_02445 [Thermoanaerobaculia bacterium]|nr:hypothetical protein [Thermoanaerobaculia bacterium]